MKNLIGQRFGKLLVIKRSANTKQGKATWICKCDCGKTKEKPVVSNDLTSGKVRSCGCLYKESNKGRNKTHGQTHTRIYYIWSSMRQRCKKNNRASKYYFNKNISVCDEWLNFPNFYKWAIDNGYSDNLTIDRIDNSKGYNPDNCRWADYKTQERNKTNNRKITINGETYVLAEWAEKIGISRATLLWRIDHGWSENDLFLKPNLANGVIRRKK